jgi:hypothetical protein
MRLRAELMPEVRRTRLLAALAIYSCPPLFTLIFPVWLRAHCRLTGREPPPELRMLAFNPIGVLLRIGTHGGVHGMLVALPPFVLLCMGKLFLRH